MSTPRRSGRGRRRRDGGAPVEMHVRAVVHGGAGIANESSEGAATTLVQGVFPGEVALVAPLGSRGGIARARLVRVLQPSAQRVQPACAVAERCGGCPWMAWSLASQRGQKLQWVREAVLPLVPEARRDQLATDLSLVAPDAEGLGYRRTARLAWHRSGQGLSLGYRGAGSRRVVDAPSCPILAPDLAQAWIAIRGATGGHLAGGGEIVLASTPQGAVAELRTDDAQSPALYAALRQLVPDAGDGALRGVALRIEATVATFGDVSATTEATDGSLLQMGDFGFLQANAQVNTELVRQVIALAEPADASILELYAGHGNFTIALAQHAAALTAVEVDPSAAEACRRNLLERGLGRARVVAGDVAERAAGPRVDVVVLDPPRTGARDVLPAVVARRPQRIVYVSCDLPTLRRDLATLAEAGYAVDALSAFDMFPHTAHVETLVRLGPTQPARD